MKGLVLYRSHFGNTQIVAETLVRHIHLQGHDAVLQDVRHNLPSLDGLDFVLVGSPTRFARPDGRAVRVLKELHKRGFSGRVAVFDTFGPLPPGTESVHTRNRWLYPGAAGILHRTAGQLGLNVYPEALRCAVQGGQKGPLADYQLEQAVSFIEEFVSSLKPTEPESAAELAALASLY